MKSHDKNKASTLDMIQYRLGADKKKTIMALCLIGVMAVMWGRVLFKKGPENAQSADSANTTKGSQESSRIANIEFIKLPNVAGRNDMITRDFFASAGWKNFYLPTGSEDTTDDRDSGEEARSEGVKEIVAKITSALKLEAVREGDNPEASINGKLIRTGDIIQINDGINKYNCEVVKIEDCKVHVRCGNVQVVLKLPGILK